MILVDTSVWVDHLRRGDPRLRTLLERQQVAVHPFVIGELACGTLRNRAEVLGLLRALPSAPMAGDDEALTFIEHHRLMGRGIGYVDVHLLASAALAEDTLLWTHDRRLAEVAEATGLGYAPADSPA